MLASGRMELVEQGVRDLAFIFVTLLVVLVAFTSYDGLRSLLGRKSSSSSSSKNVGPPRLMRKEVRSVTLSNVIESTDNAPVRNIDVIDNSSTTAAGASKFFRFSRVRMMDILGNHSMIEFDGTNCFSIIHSVSTSSSTTSNTD